MSRPLSDYTSIELFKHGADVLEKMCASMTKSHSQVAAVLDDQKIARSMLRHSLRTCLEGVGDILNGIDLVDDELAELSEPLFEEINRRFSRLSLE